ncbi:MAG TPA: HAD family hydrolase, partial [Allocoleopsis sp.]
FEDIQAVVYDKDGTLASSEAFLRNLAQRRARLIDAQIPGVQEPLLMAFGLEGNQIHPAGLMAVGTRWENEIAAAAYVAETGRGWAEALQIVHSSFAEADRYMPPKSDQTPLIPGAIELLQRLDQAAIKLAILSSDSAENVEAFVNHSSLQSYFKAICGVDPQYVTKSDPQLLSQLFKMLEVPPAQSLLIGDSQLDVQIAKAAGMAGCISFLGGWSSNFSIADATSTVHRFDEIVVG